MITLKRRGFSLGTTEINTKQENDPLDNWHTGKPVLLQKAIIDELAIENLDSVVCYQSKVGPLEWLKPSTETEIERAGKDGVPIVILPIAFVSEHSETLVELDIEYKELADEHGVIGYERVPALGIEPHYINALHQLCINARSNHTASHTGDRLCPMEFGKCICKDAF